MLRLTTRAIVRIGMRRRRNCSLCQPASVPDDTSGTLIFQSPRFTEPVVVMKLPQPQMPARSLVLRYVPAPKRVGPDSGPGKALARGDRFGGLTILGRVMRPAQTPRSGHFYSCKCDCGRVITRQRDTIVTRHYATCGCGIQRNLTGQIFGKLTVLSECRRIASPGRNTEWKVTCACGNQAWIRATALKSGETRSCGCLRGQPRATAGGSTA